MPPKGAAFLGSGPSPSATLQDSSPPKKESTLTNQLSQRIQPNHILNVNLTGNFIETTTTEVRIVLSLQSATSGEVTLIELPRIWRLTQ